MITVRIGRSPDNDIVIHDDSLIVSRYHATVNIHDNGTMTICDMSKNGTYVNGVRIPSQIEKTVTKTDIVTFAKTKPLDWNLISIPNQYIHAYNAPEPHQPSFSQVNQKDKTKQNSTTKIIGWALIAVGIIGIFNNGISFTFEGICAVSAPIIGGIILLKRYKKEY